MVLVQLDTNEVEQVAEQALTEDLGKRVAQESVQALHAHAAAVVHVLQGELLERRIHVPVELVLQPGHPEAVQRSNQRRLAGSHARTLHQSLIAQLHVLVVEIRLQQGLAWVCVLVDRAQCRDGDGGARRAVVAVVVRGVCRARGLPLLLLFALG